MGGNASPISDLMQRMNPQQQPTPQPGPGANYQAPPANVYKQQQAPTQVSPFVQQQMQMQRGLGQQQYVSPLQSMLSRILAGHNPQQFGQQQFNPQQFNPQRMMQQGMPQQGYGQMYRPDMAQVQQNLYRVSAPYIPPPPPTPAPEPEAAPAPSSGDSGGGG